jgi:hypothetical protein
MATARRGVMVCRMLILLTFILFGSTGCAALPLATLGTVLGFAGTAATAGPEVYNLGKLDFSAWATFEECRSAVDEATADLQLHIEHSDFVGKRRDEIVFKLADDQKKRINVHIDRRTGKLCQCRVDVGIFGSEPTAKLIMERIRSHLPRVVDQRGVFQKR